MEATWKIISGGRLKNQTTENASFWISSDNSFDNLLTGSSPMKESFADKLKRRLPIRAQDCNLGALRVSYQSEVVVGASASREVELLVFIKDENESLLWYFLLTSPEKDISHDHLDEIVNQVLHRLPFESTDNNGKGCP